MPTGKGSYGSKVGRPSKAKKPKHSKSKMAKKGSRSPSRQKTGKPPTQVVSIFGGY